MGKYLCVYTLFVSFYTVIIIIIIISIIILGYVVRRLVIIIIIISIITGPVESVWLLRFWPDQFFLKVKANSIFAKGKE